MWISWMLVLFSIPSLYDSLPNGAPKCAINATVIEKGHGTPSDPNAGFYLDVKKTNESLWVIKIKNSRDKKEFKGILMYVVGKDPKDHLGMFVNLNESKYKFQTKICTDLGFKGDKQSTITHRNPNSVSVDSNIFYWKPLHGDKMKMCPFIIKAVIATSPSPWQVLKDFPIQLKKYKKYKPVKKCKPKKHPMRMHSMYSNPMKSKDSY